MLNIGTRTATTQTVLSGGLIDIGFVYSKYCKKTAQCLPNFAVASNGITLNGEGKYHITATFVISGTEAGIATINALENGIENGSFASETITIPTTEIRTISIDFYTMVDSTCVLGQRSVVPKTISFENAGVGVIYSLVNISIDKVV